MVTKAKHTIVVLPNETTLEVSYFCTDRNLTNKQKQDFIDLIIQLNDCHHPVRIPKLMANANGALDDIVHNAVISAKGHLCN